MYHNSAHILHPLSKLQSIALDNMKGRTLFSSLVYSSCKEKTEFLIETTKLRENEMLAHLGKYKLRANVQIEQTDLKVFVVSKDGLKDPRCDELPMRLLNINSTPTEHLENLNDYGKQRFLNGIAEGDEIPVGENVPFDFNFDLLNGVDFEKGCYLGQELIIRTHHSGVVRKRCVCIKHNGQLSIGQRLGPTGRECQIIAVKENLALAIVKLDSIPMLSGPNVEFMIPSYLQHLQ